jgi:hypothetical protein
VLQDCDVFRVSKRGVRTLGAILTSSYRRKIVWMLSVVDDVFVKADSRLQLFLQQIDLVQETGCRPKAIGEKWTLDAEVHLQDQLDVF